MGSGHILVYAFDVFMQLYVSEGFRERDAAELIMTNNLFGLEIDKRAYQLAYFAIMMKGREYSRRILSKDITLNLHQFINSVDIPTEFFSRLKELSPLSHSEFEKHSNLLNSTIVQFTQATEIGSVLNLSNVTSTDISVLRGFIEVFEDFSNMDILYQIPEALEKVKSIIDIVEVLIFKYEAIATNPPYLNKMSTILDKYVKANYPDVKTDLFSVFIKMNSTMLSKDGYAGFMTPFVWMFIKSYESLRGFLIREKSISNLVQMEYSAFEEATVPVCCFTIKNSKNEPVGNYFKLSEFRGGMKVQKNKVLEAIKEPTSDYFYQTNQHNLKKIPGTPISFWVSENIYQDFLEKKIYDYGDVKSGIMSNSKFILEWFEVNNYRIQFKGRELSDMKNFRWFPLNSGGGFRKWYGNNGPIIDLEDNGKRIKHSNTNHRLRNSTYYFKKGITWGRITSSDISFRESRQGNLFGDAGPMMFIEDDSDRYFILGLANSKVVLELANVLNPTLNFQVDDFKNLPVFMTNERSTINSIIINCIELSKKDEFSHEFSWDFREHPLI